MTKIKVWLKYPWQGAGIFLAIITIGLLFQSCAKSGNSPNTSQQASVGGPGTSGGLGAGSQPDGGPGTSSQPVTVNQVTFAKSNSATVTAAAGSPLEVTFNFSMSTSVFYDAPQAIQFGYCEIEDPSGNPVVGWPVQMSLKPNGPTVNGITSYSTTPQEVIVPNIPNGDGTFYLVFYFLNAAHTDFIPLNMGSGVTQDPTPNSSIYRVGTITVTGAIGAWPKPTTPPFP